VFTLLHIKTLIDIGLVPHTVYDEHSDGATGNEQLQGDDINDKKNH
jgi:hypothetical protein